jgi:hypothetical protein
VFIAINGTPIESLSSTAKVTNAARESLREREREICFKVRYCPFTPKLIDSDTGLRNRKEKKIWFYTYIEHTNANSIVSRRVISLSCENWRFTIFQLEFWSENWRFFVDVFMRLSVHNLQSTFCWLCFLMVL